MTWWVIYYGCATSPMIMAGYSYLIHRRAGWTHRFAARAAWKAFWRSTWLNAAIILIIGLLDWKLHG